MAEALDDLMEAIHQGVVTESSQRNLRMILHRFDCEDWERRSIAELVEGALWEELNDRFSRALSFGTGGLRGRTIAKHVTAAERGNGTPTKPQFPAAGTNTLNYYTVALATRGLVRYVKQAFPDEHIRIAIAYDTRLFSPEFAQAAATVIRDAGGIAYVFPDPSPTPELSFAVRRLRAHAGIVITASHNPPHDNGYKVYFSDGGQIVERHAEPIMRAIAACQNEPKLEKDAATGQIASIDASMDDAYLDAVHGLVIRPETFARLTRPLKIAYTSLHGTGIKVVPKSLERLGVDLALVPQQAQPDGTFPTVQSPNPENKDALALGVALAGEVGAVAVLATDPDCDRLGVSALNPDGEFEYLTGNQIASLLANYRLSALFEQAILNTANAQHAVILKTYVTTQLLNSIARKYGVACIDTLTGFKYTGAKLRDYELRAGGRGDRSRSEWRTRLLEASRYCVLAAEESLGLLAEDSVRDKDAAAGAVMVAELLAHAAYESKSVFDLLSDLYSEHGVYRECLRTMTFEGETGVAIIKAVLASYEADPPHTWAGEDVSAVDNFATSEHVDADGEILPRELMIVFSLSSGSTVTIRGSGTEPKIKFYLAAKEAAGSRSDVPAAIDRAERKLLALWAFAQEDVERRRSATA